MSVIIITSEDIYAPALLSYQLTEKRTNIFFAEGKYDLFDKFSGKRIIKISLKGANGKTSSIELYTEEGEFILKTNRLC